MLLEAGADLHAQDQEGQTPLHCAALCEHEQVRGAASSARLRALQGLMASGVQMCALLLQHGADPAVRDAGGQSAEDLLPQLVSLRSCQSDGPEQSLAAHLHGGAASY